MRNCDVNSRARNKIRERKMSIIISLVYSRVCAIYFCNQIVNIQQSDVSSRMLRLPVLWADSETDLTILQSDTKRGEEGERERGYNFVSIYPLDGKSARRGQDRSGAQTTLMQIENQELPLIELTLISTRTQDCKILYRPK